MEIPVLLLTLIILLDVLPYLTKQTWYIF